MSRSCDAAFPDSYDIAGGIKTGTRAFSVVLQFRNCWEGIIVKGNLSRWRTGVPGLPSAEDQFSKCLIVIFRVAALIVIEAGGLAAYMWIPE